jgi:hypothetical protein
VGNNSTTLGGHNPTGPIVERLMTGTELRLSRDADERGEPAVICETQGEMSQQGSEAAHGSYSTPQQFLRLVGCRDPNARFNKAQFNQMRNPGRDLPRRLPQDGSG